MNILGHIAVITHDAAKMKTFYEKLLDLRLDFETDSKEYVQYSAPRCEHRLDLENIGLIQADIAGSNYKGVFLRVQSDNLESIKSLCESYGGKVVREPEKKDYGKTEMYIEDPEGNLIQAYSE